MAAADCKGASSVCRLCVGALNANTNFGIDLTQVDEIRTLVNDMYTVKVLPTDHVKCICIACYKKMMTHYKNLQCRTNKKRLVKTNIRMQQQLKIVDGLNSKAAASRKPVKVKISRSNTSERKLLPTASIKKSVNELPAKEKSSSSSERRVHSPSSPVEQNNNKALKGSMTTSKHAPDEKRPVKDTGEHNGSVAVPSVSSAKDSPVAVESKTEEKFSVEQNRTVSSADKPPRAQAMVRTRRNSVLPDTARASNVSVNNQPTSSEEAVSTVCSSRWLVPVLMDCLAQPEYLDALFPLKISINKDAVKPLEYLCDNCFLTFSSHDEFRSHSGQRCAKTCRYCYAHIKSDHTCAFSSKYSFLEPHIKGSDKYARKAENSMEKEPSETTEKRSTKPKHVAKNSKDTSTINKKKGHDKNPKKESVRTTACDSESASMDDSSVDSSLSLTACNESNAESSDADIQDIVNSIRKNLRTKMKAAKKISSIG